jgi:YidC/Oxa1 family membrane protein insertase
MNNQKFFLLTAIALSIFLLWDKWQLKQNPPQQISSQTQQTSHTTLPTGEVIHNEDIPTLTANTDVPSLSPNAATRNKKTITIDTDVLQLEIDENSAIVGAKLKQYPKTLGSEEVVELLARNNEKFYIIQSGLAPKNIMPTHLAIWQVANDSYTLTGDTLTVPFVWEKNGIKVVKNFRFSKDSYLVKVDYEVHNTTNKDITTLSYNRLNRHKIDQGSLMMPTFSGGAHYDTQQELYEKFDFDDFSDGNTLTTKGGWGSLVEHYFISAIIPNRNQKNTFKTKVVGSEHTLNHTAPTIVVPAGQTTTIDAAHFYIGPKEKARIDNVVKGLDHTVDYSWLYIIAMPLAEFLYWIFSLVGSWGLAIIVLTVIIKLAFYKLSEKSYSSMAGMRKLAPRLEHLKATYGDDRVKMGQKTMELYKEAKVNPASGCLPILVQMPVFISLYWVLIEMVELRQIPFLYLPDLSAADPYYILPIIMGLSMFVQQKLNPKPTDPMQAKIMMSLPFVFTIFFLWFPSGLVLYWVLNNILSIAQQWYINKKVEG